MSTADPIDKDTTSGSRVGSWAAAALTVITPRENVRILRHAPRPEDGDDREGGSRAHRHVPPEQQQRQRQRTEHDAGNHEGKAPLGEAVEEPRRVRVEDPDARDRGQPCDHSHDDGPTAKVLRELRFAVPLAVARQVYGSEIGGDLDGEEAAEQRRRVEPAGDHVASRDPDGDASGRDGSGDRPEKEGGHHRRRGEGDTECPLE